MNKKVMGCEVIENEIRNPRLYKYSPWLFRYYKAFDIINKFLDKVDNNERVAIWGAGRHTMVLWSGISMINRTKIGYIIEKNPQRHFDEYGIGVPIIYPAEIESLPIDMIIISSYLFKKEIEEEINRLDKQYTVLNIYAELYDVDNVTDLFADVRTEFYYGVEYNYDSISESLIDLNNSVNLENTKLILKKLIGEYLHIKDFCNAFAYIDRLCALKDAESDYYLSLKDKIIENLEHIKRNIGDKQHIILNWIDQLVAEDLPNMSFVTSLAEEGVFFENVYTQTDYTKPTMATIFTGGLYLDDLLYKMSIDDFQDSELYTKIISNGYSFKYFGGVFASGIFTNPNTLIYRNVTYYMQNPSMVYQWEALKELESNDGKCFLLIHNLCETHTPCLNGAQADLEYWIEKDLFRPDEGIGPAKAKKRRDQLTVSQEYLDSQLQFYMNCYRNVKANILMSDHGLYREAKFGEYRYTRCMRVFLTIVGKEIQSRKIKEILSLRKLPWIIQCIFENKSCLLENYTEEYALIQTEDVYHYRGMCRFFQNLDAAKQKLIQHRGVVTLNDIYIHSVLGEEYYYLQGDEINNYINEEKYQSRINELRKIAGNKFVNIYTEPKYITTRRVYELLGYKIPADTEYIS